MTAAVDPWQSTWHQITAEHDNLRALYRSRPVRRGMDPDRPDTTQALFQHLYQFAEAVAADPTVPPDVQQRALVLQSKPAAGPIKRCGDITNTDKDAGRRPGKTCAVLIRHHVALPNPGRPMVEGSYRVQYTDPQDNITTQDALDLADAACETWQTFLLSNGLVER